MKTILFIILLAFAVFAGCSDDTTSPKLIEVANPNLSVQITYWHNGHWEGGTQTCTSVGFYDDTLKLFSGTTVIQQHYKDSLISFTITP